MAAIVRPRLPRSWAFAWRHGRLARQLALVAAACSGLAMAVSGWQGWRLQARASALASQVQSLDGQRRAVVQAMQETEPPDVALSLPPPPTVAQVLQTMQRAAQGEGARVTSLQAERHAATAAELGQLDLALSIEGSYPAILVVLREVLDRYPGASLRTLSLGGAMASAASGTGGAGVEARVMLVFWSRPLRPDAAATGEPAGRKAAG